MKPAALLLLLLPLAARAQWAVDGRINADGDALVLIGLVCSGIAFFWIRGQFARSQAHGQGAVAVVAILAALAVVFPATRGLLALVTAAWLLYGFFRPL